MCCCVTSYAAGYLVCLPYRLNVVLLCLLCRPLCDTHHTPLFLWVLSFCPSPQVLLYPLGEGWDREATDEQRLAGFSCLSSFTRLECLRITPSHPQLCSILSRSHYPLRSLSITYASTDTISLSGLLSLHSLRSLSLSEEAASDQPDSPCLSDEDAAHIGSHPHGTAQRALANQQTGHAVIVLVRHPGIALIPHAFIRHTNRAAEQ